MATLLDAAVARDIDRIEAVVSPQNRASIGLLRSFGPRINLIDGLVEAEPTVPRPLALAA